MNYSREEIFQYSGQFDKTVTVSFKYESKAQKEYGNHITGDFYYTPKERIELENLIKKEDFDKTDGLIKFKVSNGINKLTNEQVNNLRFEGIMASDIIEILQFSNPVENEFSKTDIKNLPDPITINVDLSNRDEEEMMLWLNSQRLKDGYKLIPEEINRHNGVILRKYENIMSSEDLKNFKDINSGVIKKDLKYHYLKSKYYKDLLTDEEKTEFENIIKEEVDEKVKILGKELQKSQEKWKSIGIDYKQALAWLIHFSSDFRPERLTHGKIPVWWDYESLLHIYMRHVSETKIGERFEAKTVFQYKFSDIKTVIETVLQKTEKEIIEHFTLYPEKDFKRVGEQSVYYKGDYYVFHINTKGKLITFYKDK